MNRSFAISLLALGAVAGFPALCAGASPADTKGPVCHGRPADRVGTTGPDRIHARPGSVVVSGPGSDRVVGRSLTVCASLGSDVVRTTGTSWIRGGAGDDLLRGGAGDDRIAGNGGSDRIWGGAGWDVLSGGRGNDRIFGEHGVNLILGGPGTDLLFGGPGSDWIYTGSGNDFVSSGGGADVVIGGNPPPGRFRAQAGAGSASSQRIP